MKGKYINKNLIYLVLFIYLIHTFTIKLSAIAAVISIIEEAVVIAFLFYKPRYFIFSVILLMSGSFDVGEFVDGKDFLVYNIGNVPFAKGYLLIFLITFVYCIRRTNKKFLKRIIANPNYIKVLRITDYIIFMGVLMGFICLILNDNNITNINWLKYFFYDYVAFAIVPMIGICLLSDITLYGKRYLLRLQQLMIAILICIPLCALCSALCGLFGTYGGDKILLAPLNLFLAPTIIFFVFYKKYNLKGIIFCTFLISLFLQLFYSNALGGKSWLSLIYIFATTLIILHKQGHKKAVFNSLLLLSIIIFSFSGYLMTTIKSQGTENHSMAKLNQVVMLLSVSDALWYYDMPLSPRNRLEEFVNISLEFEKKPQSALIGKGFGGSIKDHIPFSINDDGAYSADQYQNHSFISLHETINNIFLKYGIIGMIMIFILLKYIFKQLDNNPWGAIGGLWLVFFYGYSIVLGFYGISCIVLSLVLSQQKNTISSSTKFEDLSKY